MSDKPSNQAPGKPLKASGKYEPAPKVPGGKPKAESGAKPAGNEPAAAVTANAPRTQKASGASDALKAERAVPASTRFKDSGDRKKFLGSLSPKWILGLKIVGGLAAFGLVLALGALIYAMIYINGLKADLPAYEQLAEYEPPVTTRVHAGDGTLVAEFARERRLFVPIDAIPDHVKQAFLSAEDKSFYEHSGLDYRGILRAQINNIPSYLGFSNAPLEGGSTITQQVAKNFLLSSEQRIERKVREMLIARRMEQTFTKDHILELYLNEIYLGNRSYGVAAAALNYFEKPLQELSIAQAAYLSALAKAPSNYHPVYNVDRAIARRNWIVNRMYEDGAITEEEATLAQEEPLGAVVAPPLGARTSDTEYFAEEIRRQIADRYGIEALYDGGLSVRSTLDPRLQQIAQESLRNGLVTYDRRHGWRGPVTTIQLPTDLSLREEPETVREGEEPPFIWQALLSEQKDELEKADGYHQDLEPWQIAVVLDSQQGRASIGLLDGTQGEIPLAAAEWARAYVAVNEIGPAVTDLRNVIKAGDVVYVDQWTGEGSSGSSDLYALQQIPAVNGGMLAIDPHTGRVKAMVGGFSFGLSEFNRATQARRQPGSTFKPFVYAAALDNGYTPSSLVLDAPFVAPSLGDDWWKPGNYVAGSFYGESTLRLGIEKSRNTMTARLAQDIGIGLIIEYAERFGVSDTLQRELAISLGAGETSLLRLTTAYTMFVNGGRRVEPIFIDRVQDRYGETVYNRDQRPCEDCKQVSWEDQNEPFIPDTRQQVIDPRTAYQMVSMLEGVTRSGTGASVGKVVDKPIAGKTGTTNDYKDAWFVGFSPDLAVGIFVGFDMPQTMGQGEGGGIVAAPIFGEFMEKALAEETGVPFRIPSGIRLVRVNAKTGKPARPGETNVILEAFKAEDDIEGSSRFRINGQSVDEGNADEAIDDVLGGLY
ncbi:penicillin-binding protein 1A [Parvularcula sp. IMCC14364]|uniref:penicillin-binding protein 1A n=1 Tax=Parvularcula sp. IMCC14364 TaxID=3067902 RepID=UPI002740C2CD|nr:penicillin-binding protein 1A [Parvularcula sp. IMCC14364]